MFVNLRRSTKLVSPFRSRLAANAMTFSFRGEACPASKSGDRQQAKNMVAALIAKELFVFVTVGLHLWNAVVDRGITATAISLSLLEAVQLDLTTADF